MPRRIVVGAAVLIAACTSTALRETPRHETPDSETPRSGARQANDTAQRIVTRRIVDSQSGAVTVELSTSAIDRLRARSASRPDFDLADPVRAARLFARALDLPPSTRFELLSVSKEIEEGPGAFVATVRATSSEESIVMRLLSDPDETERPTVWLLNDYWPSPSKK